MTAKLPWQARFMHAQYRFSDRLRPKAAFTIANEPGLTGDFAGLAGARQCLIVSVRRSGEPVPTPVLFGLDGGALYFRTMPHVAKVTRIRANARVRVCATNARGRPTGPLVQGTARVVPDSGAARARAAVAANWSRPVRVLEWFYDRIGVPMIYIEVRPYGGA